MATMRVFMRSRFAERAGASLLFCRGVDDPRRGDRHGRRRASWTESNRCRSSAIRTPLESPGRARSSPASVRVLAAAIPTRRRAAALARAGKHVEPAALARVDHLGVGRAGHERRNGRMDEVPGEHRVHRKLLVRRRRVPEWRSVVIPHGSRPMRSAAATAAIHARGPSGESERARSSPAGRSFATPPDSIEVQNGGFGVAEACGARVARPGVALDARALRARPRRPRA